MFKVEIETGNGMVNKIFQNTLEEDWVRFLLKNHKVTKDKVKIYWIREITKKDTDMSKIDLEIQGKVRKGEKLNFKLTGDKVHVDSYNKFLDRLDQKSLVSKSDFLKPAKMKLNVEKSTLVEVKDLSIFNKEWFLPESEFTLVPLRWPYDENMKFIGFDFDPERI